MSGSDSDMDRQRMICLVIFLGLVRGGFSQQCSNEDYREMQNKFSTCFSEVSSSQSLSPCDIVQKIVTECAEKMKDCDDDKQVRQMTNQHIDRIINHYGAGEGRQEMENCQVVKEFRDSSRITELHPEVELCSDTKTREVQNQNQNCSHEIAISVYETIETMIDTELIKQLLCDSLKTINNKCINLLSKCYAKEDFKQMRGISLEEMRGFLIQIVGDKLPKNALDNCKAMVEKGERIEVIQPSSTSKPIRSTQPTTTPTTTRMTQPPTTSRTLVVRNEPALVTVTPKSTTTQATTTTTTVTTTTTTEVPIAASANQVDPRGGSGSVRSPWSLVIVTCVILGIRTFT